MAAKPKILATKGNFQLVFEPNRLDCYAVYSLENGRKSSKDGIELARSSKLTKSVTMWFTKDQIRDAKARIQAAKRVAKIYCF